MGFIIEPPNPNEARQIAWRATGLHLQKQFQRFSDDENDPNGFQWLRIKYAEPAFDDLMFAYKNQVFSVLILIIEKQRFARLRTEKYLRPESTYEFRRRELQLDESKKFNITPCLFPILEGNFEPATTNGWNLFHARTLEPLLPETMATDALIPKSALEINNLLIQFTRDYVLPKMNAEPISFCEIPDFFPQMWFAMDDTPCWMLIRHIREGDPQKPHDTDGIIKHLVTSKSRQYPMHRIPGYFLGVGILDVDRHTETLYRGAGPFAFKTSGPEPLYTPYDPYKPKIERGFE